MQNVVKNEQCKKLNKIFANILEHKFIKKEYQHKYLGVIAMKSLYMPRMAESPLSINDYTSE